MMMMMMMHNPKPRVIIPGNTLDRAGAKAIWTWTRKISLSVGSRTPVAGLQAVALPPVPTFRLIKSRGMGWEWNPAERKNNVYFGPRLSREETSSEIWESSGEGGVECEVLSCCRWVYHAVQ
jgi:hypothetical protein